MTWQIYKLKSEKLIPFGGINAYADVFQTDFG